MRSRKIGYILDLIFFRLILGKKQVNLLSEIRSYTSKQDRNKRDKMYLQRNKKTVQGG